MKRYIRALALLAALCFMLAEPAKTESLPENDSSLRAFLMERPMIEKDRAALRAINMQERRRDNQLALENIMAENLNNIQSAAGGVD